MAIHWQVKFRSLRANELYTVNIYDDNYSGQPVQLIGASQPFVTQEDDNDDMFASVRTQSGYIRIVDDGTINWRSIIPTTDIDRPVTLTDSGGNIKWQGFMQAQNFGAELYGNPQEREFPIQCGLSVVSRADVSHNNKKIQNFAYLLQEIIDAIPQVGRPKTIVVQGGADAKAWLLKRIDWYNMLEEDSDYVLQGKYDLMECLEHMCNFWGWCARTYAETLYLTCADDSGEANALVLRHDSQQDDLADLADGIDAGSIDTMLSTLTIGNIFASTENNDYQMRGPSKVTLTADINDTDGEIIDPMDDRLRKEMVSTPWNNGYRVGDVHYSQDVLSIQRNEFYGNGFSLYGSFNVAHRFISDSEPQNSHWEEVGNVIHLKKTSDRTYAFVQLTSEYEHAFDEGFFRLWGEAYWNGEKMDTTEGRWFSGDADMWMRFGIGHSRESAMWWNGKEWVDSITVFRATIGNRDDNIFTRWWTGSVFDTAVESNIIDVSQLSGYIYLEFLGTDSQLVEEIDGEKVIDIKDFKLQFTKNDTVSKDGPYPNSGWYDIQPVDVKNKHTYKAQNNNQNVREEHGIDCIFGSENDMSFGYGLLIDPDDSYMVSAPYNGLAGRPETHYVNRISAYWATSKRKIECDLLVHDGMAVTVANGINPRNKAVIDGTIMYPVSISRDWRDDIVRLILMEV